MCLNDCPRKDKCRYLNTYVLTPCLIGTQMVVALFKQEDAPISSSQVVTTSRQDYNLFRLILKPIDYIDLLDLITISSLFPDSIQVFHSHGIDKKHILEQRLEFLSSFNS